MPNSPHDSQLRAKPSTGNNPSRISRWIALFLLIGMACQAQVPETAPEGFWQGTLDTGGGKLRLALTIAKSQDASYTGEVESLDQGTVIPIDAITVHGRSVELELKAVNASFTGTLSADNSQLAGQFTQNGKTFPLTFTATTKKTESAPAKAGTPAAHPFLDAPIDTIVPTPPTAFRGDGKTHLVYEVHITNFARNEIELKGLEVLDENNKVLAEYSAPALALSILRPGVDTSDKLRIGGGLRAVLYMWVTLEPNAEVPRALHHKISLSTPVNGQSFDVDCARTEVRRDPIVIGPPLRGGQWLAANGPSNTSGHRRALIPVGGAVHISQRFAIDWVQLRDDGKTYTGDPLDNKNYRAFGADVLAVADGTVTEVKDGIPLNVPGRDSRAVPITLETIGGNHIILDIGGGHYAFYAHLQPGKIRVKLGDHVHRGDVLAVVGNTGNSTEPHLHFHISDGNSPLGSEGLPYAFSEFEVEGKGWGWKPNGAPLVKHQMEMPLENAVVQFER